MEEVSADTHLLCIQRTCLFSPPPPPLHLLSAGESFSEQTDTCLPACLSPLTAFLEIRSFASGTPPPLSPLRAHPTRLRDGRGGRCHAWMRRWMDDEWMDGSRVSPWEVSMCACLCVCACGYHRADVRAGECRYSGLR